MIPSAHIIQTGLYRRKKISHHLLLGEGASHKLLYLRLRSARSSGQKVNCKNSRTFPAQKLFVCRQDSFLNERKCKTSVVATEQRKCFLGKLSLFCCHKTIPKIPCSNLQKGLRLPLIFCLLSGLCIKRSWG